MTDSELNKGKTASDTSAVESLAPKFDRHPLAELKNGKILFKQKPVSFEKLSETMQEIVLFREMLEQRSQTSPLDTFPEEHLPLIAKLVHESDKTITALTKHICHVLKPTQLEEPQNETPQTSPLGINQLTPLCVETAILSIAERKNYGVELLEKVPASLCVWRWEVKEEKRDWLPKAGQEKAQARMAERQQAKKDVLNLFELLPQDVREGLLKGTKKDKGKGKLLCADATISNEVGETEISNSPQKAKHEGENEEELKSPGGSIGKKGIGRAKKDKPVDVEKSAKEKEKAEKKAAKVEKERKEKEAQTKSRSLLSAFLAKPKPSGKLVQVVKTSTPSAPASKQTASSSQSDFERSFKPFVVKKDATVAPINWFVQKRKDEEVIILDQEAEALASNAVTVNNDPSVNGPSPEDLLRSFLKNPPISSALPGERYSKPLRGYAKHFRSTPTHCVRNILTELTEAEVAGDTSVVRHLTELLKSRTAIPVKVLIFHDDTRPGYFGTFTKGSTVIGPRCPMKKDAVTFDYSYDSGAEWEEEEEGGDDLMSLDGSGDEEDTSAGSDLDDWLIDDDTVDVDPGTPLSERSGSIELLSLPAPKRKSAANPEEKETKKKKLVVPLIPYTKGPYWEDKIGTCVYAPFKHYQIRLFNDTPSPIDPFTFVSSPVMGDQSSASNHVFAVPAVPAYARNSPQNTLPVASDPGVASSSTATAPLPSKHKSSAMPPPKTTFPELHLPLLVNKIDSLATGNLTWIVESIYQELKEHKVKKNAIEAKVREVGEKCRFKKVWVVKDNNSTYPSIIPP